ncbi:MAG: S-layer homology domain-containing protein [Clostridia bacterium]|nr:S-layer homology domain-containing protein [Clostridia bacterium]
MKNNKKTALKSFVALALFAVLFFVSGFSAMGAGASFGDVSASDYYCDAVNWAVDMGITTGVSDTMFAPGETCTRAQMVSFLWRAVGKPKAGSNAPVFSDVSKSDYYYTAVMWAAGHGITLGASDGRFDPDGSCTRAQAVSFIYRAMGEPKAGAKASFSDVSAGAYYYNAVMWASGEGVTVGTSKNTFSPDKVCTRAEIITFLYRSYNAFMA